MQLNTPFNSFFKMAGRFLLLGLLCACGSSKKLNTNNIYFQTGPNSIIAQKSQTIIQINDEISIVFYSQTSNQEQAAIFNIPPAAGSSGNSIQGYKVNSEGNIEIPVIGAVRAAGDRKSTRLNSSHW